MEQRGYLISLDRHCHALLSVIPICTPTRFIHNTSNVHTSNNNRFTASPTDLDVDKLNLSIGRSRNYKEVQEIILTTRFITAGIER